MAGVPSSSGPPGSHAHRVIFIDLARALAVVFMLYGHTIDALLAPEYRVGTWYGVWQFQRGLTSSLFLLLAGFAFSVATSKRWTSHVHPSPAVLTRLRRFATFVLLGYALHFPVGRLVDLPTATDAQWRAFLAVDVLQLIGVTFIAVQLLVFVTRSRAVFTAVALALAVGVVAGAQTSWSTDWAGTLPDWLLANLGLAVGVVAGAQTSWSTDWAGTLPDWLLAYLGPSSGSLFPVFPWSAFILLGAGLGQVYARWGGANLAAYENVVLLLPGTLMVAAVLGLRALSVPLFGGPGTFLPSEFLLRSGVVLVGLAGIAHASRRISRLPRVFSAVAQETLLVYFVHLCIVYGSVWNTGLARFYGRSLGPWWTLAAVVALMLSMTGLAWYWNWCKHTRPRAARWISAVVGLLLVLSLL